MASGDTKTQQYLDIAARGTRADLQRGCCNTRTQDLIMDVAERIITEEETRYREDQILQGEIDEIKNNPDVVDIVPTYAALQNYDTSGLTDKDIIRVLADETHDGASTYYRYSTATGTFTYIGKVGSYYTEDEVDALLAEKQDNLIAGANIQIAADGKTISATDTTYTAGAGLILTGTQFAVDTATIAQKSDIPTAVSALTNDAGYQTAADVAAAINAEEVPSSADWNAIFTAPVQNANNMGF